MTGLWQVSGRSDVPFNDMVRLDLHYVRNWSIGLDLEIMLRTIPAVLANRGAY
jgi:lipopolysaccharide/colanic/teichoic acid biosynthesis glycosyltransferase